MKAYELKEYIIENEKIEEILEELGCWNITNHTKEYRCSSPFSDNRTALRIKKDNLSVRCYTPSFEFQGDIFVLIMKIKNISFTKSIKYLHKILGLKFSYGNYIEEKPKYDILSYFKKAKERAYGGKKVLDSNTYEPNIISGEELFEDIVLIPFIGWIQEGILPNTQKLFKIGYSKKHNRVTIPHRYWQGDENEYLGMMGRTLNPHYKLLEIPKYFPLKAYPKSFNLFGLQENYEEIQEKGYVNVFESEKSVLKRHSRLDGTGTALCCHEISDEQVKILISLNVEIIIQMDSDIDINFIRGLCEKFYRIRPISYVIDGGWRLLGEKESPADLHNKAYNFLWNRRIKYDENEHKKYLKWKEEENEKNKRTTRKN